MPVQPYRPRALRWQIFRGSQALRDGLLTPGQLRSQAWVRLRHDVYADARLERDHELACRAAILRLPKDVVIAGPSAAYLYGVRHAAAARDAVHVIAPPDSVLGPRHGLRVHWMRLDRDEAVDLTDLSRTSAVRTAWDVAAWLDPVDSVPIIDGMLGLGLVDPAALRALALGRRGQRGARRAARAFALSDGRAQSPPESVLRVRLILAGLPQPVPQHPVSVRGRVLHPDLAWPEYGVAVEYDGIWHADGDQLHRDRRRLNELVADGWIVLHVTSQRLRTDFPGIVREVRAALTRRGWRG